MSLRTCKECPCGKKVAGGPLGMFTEIWCEKMQSKKEPSQEACSWAKEQERKGWPRGCK